jgi:glyoxylase-like metal-dependent hydrolase (beta-lactamase superfamily II)
MAAWMMLSVPRELNPPPSAQHLVQLDRVGKGALSYLLISNGQAIVIDPPRDFSPHLAFIENAKAHLVGVADTHVHADYISGGARLSGEYGVPYYLHPGDTVYPYDGTPGRIRVHEVRDGMNIPVGACAISVVHTPGHSPGSVTYVADHHSAFTGDFLFISSLGRPDLAEKTEEWSLLLWNSLQEVKRRWPPDLLIYPAHYASEGERRDDRTIGAALGEVVRHNAPLQKAAWPEFAGWIRRHQGTVPDAYKSIKAINVGLLSVDDREADHLELGRHECAIE